MQHFGIGKNKIPFISERNPTKVGLRCVGTDIELISEEKARNLKPKAMVVLPWYFKDEIVKREKKYIDNINELYNNRSNKIGNYDIIYGYIYEKIEANKILNTKYLIFSTLFANFSS